MLSGWVYLWNSMHVAGIRNCQIPFPLQRECLARGPAPFHPISHFIFVPDKVDLHHPAVESDPWKQIKLLSVRLKVLRHMEVARKCSRFLNGLGPWKVTELIESPWSLEPCGLDGALYPDATNSAVWLEDDRIETSLDQVLTCKEAADSGTDDRDPLYWLHLCSRESETEQRALVTARGSSVICVLGLFFPCNREGRRQNSRERWRDWEITAGRPILFLWKKQYTAVYLVFRNLWASARLKLFWFFHHEERKWLGAYHLIKSLIIQ